VRISGRRHLPESGGVLLVCNHQSFFDPMLAGIAVDREASFMARDTLFRNPWFTRLIQSVNAYPVRRGEADLGAIKETLKRLRDGKVVVIYPEGTRTLDGQIGPMLAGLAAIAKKAQVPLVPTLIDGVFQAWPKGQLIPSPADVIVEYGRPILPIEYANWTPQRLMDEVRGRLIAMQERWHSRVPGRRLKWWNASEVIAPSKSGSVRVPWARSA
jgi:1-acyl-sn-glycerol-3-phosphate acyltransferase